MENRHFIHKIEGLASIQNLRASTLVGPIRENLVLDPLAVQHLDNRLFTIVFLLKVVIHISALASGTSKNVFPTQEKLLQNIEQYVFEKVSKKLLNIRYNRTLRKIIFSLRHNEELKQKVLFEKSLNVILFTFSPKQPSEALSA